MASDYAHWEQATIKFNNRHSRPIGTDRRVAWEPKPFATQPYRIPSGSLERYICNILDQSHISICAHIKPLKHVRTDHVNIVNPIWLLLSDKPSRNNKRNNILPIDCDVKSKEFKIFTIWVNPSKLVCLTHVEDCCCLKVFALDEFLNWLADWNVHSWFGNNERTRSRSTQECAKLVHLASSK